jgi:hypothetical protein
MIGSTQHQPSLFYAAFDRQASLIKDDLLEPLDDLLDDPALVSLVRQALARRCPQSERTGRNGIAPDRLLRCLVLKHLKDWSLRELEREVRTSLVYRRFTRFDQEAIPKYCTFSRSFAALGPETTRHIHEARITSRRSAENVSITSDHILILNQRHLQLVLDEYRGHFNASRPHQGIDQRCPSSFDKPALGRKPPAGARVVAN